MMAFVALPAPAPRIAPLMRAQGHVPGGRRVAVEDLRLTVAFLDDRPQDRLAALHETLEARALPAFAGRPAACAVIAWGRPRAVAIAVALEGLSALRDAARGACRAAGIVALRVSRLMPDTPIHDALARHPLRAA